MSSWKLPSVLTWPALAVWEKIASVNFVIIWKESVQLRAQCHASLCFMNEWNWSNCSHWKPPRKLGLVWTRPARLEGSIFPINMHIMLLLRGFLLGFCTHFDWQKQWKVSIWAVRSFIINWTYFWSGRNHNEDQVFTTTVVSCSGPRPGQYIYISFTSLLSG